MLVRRWWLRSGGARFIPLPAVVSTLSRGYRGGRRSDARVMVCPDMNLLRPEAVQDFFYQPLRNLKFVARISETRVPGDPSVLGAVV